ncbi:MAG: nucleotidyltransferase substrate binding protein [Parachlamydiaceae bacterium]|nr:nucleotidyltransferase substrate binding protein [Parachlamydiaceae bacterium]
MNQDIRWEQQFSNYSKALIELKSAVELSKVRLLSKLEKQGLIQCFEYTYELAWKTLKD